MAILLNLVKIIIILDKCVHSRLRVDLGRQNAFIQSFHINTCKQHIVFLFMQHSDFKSNGAMRAAIQRISCKQKVPRFANVNVN